MPTSRRAATAAASPSVATVLLDAWRLQSTVSRSSYIAWGCALYALKYLIERRLIDTHLDPRLAFDLDITTFLTPYAARWVGLTTYAPGELAWLLVLTSMPFLFIATHLSVRRAADAGFPSCLGFLVLVPGFHYLVMALLAIAPGRIAAQRFPAFPDRWELAVFSLLSLAAAGFVAWQFRNASYGTWIQAFSAASAFGGVATMLVYAAWQSVWTGGAARDLATRERARARSSAVALLMASVAAGLACVEELMQLFGYLGIVVVVAGPLAIALAGGLALLRGLRSRTANADPESSVLGSRRALSVRELRVLGAAVGFLCGLAASTLLVLLLAAVGRALGHASLALLPLVLFMPFGLSVLWLWSAYFGAARAAGEGVVQEGSEGGGSDVGD